jgi:hypothetical protein
MFIHGSSIQLLQFVVKFCLAMSHGKWSARSLMTWTEMVPNTLASFECLTGLMAPKDFIEFSDRDKASKYTLQFPHQQIH